VARYKRTARAEARRRYREQTRATDDVAEDAPSSAATPSAARTSPAAKEDERPQSFVASVMAGLRLPDVGADVRALPRIAVRTWSFAAPLAGVAVAFLLALDPKVFRLEETPGEPPTALVGRLLYQYLLIPPPVMAIFIGGALAPRASWLVGGIVGAITTAVFFVLLAIQGPTGQFTFDATPGTAIQTIFLYLPIYLLLGGFSGWYRRWLTGRAQRTRQATEERKRAQARDARRSKATAARR
jgi:membrane protease YdiL (CAAX protease family)